MEFSANTCVPSRGECACIVSVFVVSCNLKKKKKNDPLHKQSAMSRWKVPPNKLCMRLTKEDGDLSCMSCDFSVPSI